MREVALEEGITPVAVRKRMARAFRLLAVEMETSMLYALAMRNGIEALTILSVSDNIVSGTAQTASDRESANEQMMHLALALA